MPEQPARKIRPSEPCPGLYAWKACSFVSSFENYLAESQIAKCCIGNFELCERYQGLAQSPALRKADEDEQVSSLFLLKSQFGPAYARKNVLL